MFPQNCVISSAQTHRPTDGSSQRPWHSLYVLKSDNCLVLYTFQKIFTCIIQLTESPQKFCELDHAGSINTHGSKISQLQQVDTQSTTGHQLPSTTGEMGVKEGVKQLAV